MAHRTPHPLSSLTEAETKQARDIILRSSPAEVIQFRMIFREEPEKALLVPFLALEHSGKLLPDSPRPPRLAAVHYVRAHQAPDRKADEVEATVDLNRGQVVKKTVVGTEFLAGLSTWEFDILVDKCKNSKLFQDRIAQFRLPEGFDVVIEPWPYGGMDQPGNVRRYFQGLVYAIDTRSQNPDSNFYAYPLPVIPVMDFEKREIVRIDELATGGAGDSLIPLGPRTGSIIDHCEPAEYVPELLPRGTRKDLKPLSVIQPEGPSFAVTDESLIEWQKWRFRVSFNPREGAVIHDVHFDGRSVLYRLSISEMTVPYADPRPPFQRKQAFDFGDGGIGHAVNSLDLGCDCLGVIKYFDGVLVDHEGTPEKASRVICLHEQDNGIGWKHTNWRTGRAVTVRRRELVVQFIITLANYEYIFNYKFDQTGAINVETRATGIVSVVNIDAGKTAPWGTVVSPGALAQNHQHIFCVRIDPAVDGHKNTVVQNDSIPLRIDARTNPYGNLYEVRDTPLLTSTGVDACPDTNRIFKIQNLDKKNPVSGRPVGFKINPPPTQRILADPASTQARRAFFAKHHLWVTKYRDGELYAAGDYPLSSKVEAGGVADMVARNDDLLQEDVVLWSCFGLTHNPRVEDWPVMPVEIMELHISPVDFFTENPAIDVPSSKNNESKLTNGCCAQPKL
ncbi:copper amine oxidase [Plectosphaerella cucumerina]|uniref:Amine oxidase n=1 Tax=Plectosphaerella cucumerina TaxID=40658 RepID=A0A8K0TD20_9PEZI|nr:copper amine oxidase [Plectosphaerella cucumerina]